MAALLLVFTMRLLVLVPLAGAWLAAVPLPPPDAEEAPPPQPPSTPRPPTTHIHAIVRTERTAFGRRCDFCFIVYSNCFLLHQRHAGPQVFRPEADETKAPQAHGILSVNAPPGAALFLRLPAPVQSFFNRVGYTRRVRDTHVLRGESAYAAMQQRAEPVS